MFNISDLNILTHNNVALTFVAVCFCMFLQGVCCSDGLHCCPPGTTCDLHLQRCNKVIANVERYEILFISSGVEMLWKESIH